MTRIEYKGKTYELSDSCREVTTIDGKTIWSTFPFWTDPRFLMQFETDPEFPMYSYGDLLAWLRTPSVRDAIREISDDDVKYSIMGHIEEMFNVSGYLEEDEVPITDKIRHRWDSAQNIELFRVNMVGRRGSSPNFDSFILCDPPSNTETDSIFRLCYTESDYEFGYFWICEETGSPLGEFPRELYGVMNYTFTPELNFMSLKKERTHLYLGMELEVSSALTSAELQYIVTHVHPVQEPFFYMKHDTSITGSHAFMYEIVTHPMTPRRMRTEWRKLFIKIGKLAEQKGYDLSDLFDTSLDLTNGIHLHVSRDAFVMHHPGDNLHINRFLTAFNQWDSGFQSWLQKISKRPYLPRDNEYCHVHPSFDGRTIARRLRRGSTTRARHAACHDTGATIEVRVWQGIVDLKHILSCIDLTVAMFEFTQYVPRSSFSSPRFIEEFTKFVKKARGFRNAKEAIKQCA